MDQREFTLNRRANVAQSPKARPYRPLAPGGGPRARESCGGQARTVTSASALVAAGAAAPDESPIVEETPRSARHSNSHSELLPR